MRSKNIFKSNFSHVILIKVTIWNAPSETFLIYFFCSRQPYKSLSQNNYDQSIYSANEKYL